MAFNQDTWDKISNVNLLHTCMPYVLRACPMHALFLIKYCTYTYCYINDAQVIWSITIRMKKCVYFFIPQPGAEFSSLANKNVPWRPKLSVSSLGECWVSFAYHQFSTQFSHQHNLFFNNNTCYCFLFLYFSLNAQVLLFAVWTDIVMGIFLPFLFLCDPHTSNDVVFLLGFRCLNKLSTYAPW